MPSRPHLSAQNSRNQHDTTLTSQSTICDHIDLKTHKLIAWGIFTSVTFFVRKMVMVTGGQPESPAVTPTRRSSRMAGRHSAAAAARPSEAQLLPPAYFGTTAMAASYPFSAAATMGLHYGANQACCLLLLKSNFF